MKDYNKKQDKGLDIIINSRVTTKDIWDTLWRCRDFELSHLWQRSIFLNTLLVLCFTGYGVAVMSLIETLSKKVDANDSLTSAYTINNIIMVICLVSILFSCFCIMMAKGSKAWYEKYENAISAFEDNSDYMSNPVLYSGEKIDENEVNKEAEIGSFQYRNIKGYEPITIKDNIFSCKAGAYSPSRINIAIGQVSLVLWCIAFVIHQILNFNEFQISELIYHKWIPCGLFVTFFIVVAMIRHLVCTNQDSWIKSKEILKEKAMNKDDNEKKEESKNSSYKWCIALICGILFVIAIAIASIPLFFYFNKFKVSSVLNTPSDWGVFGDFVGGTTNAILNFFTLVFSLVAVWVSIRLSTKVQETEVSLHKSDEKLMQMQSKPVPFIHLEKLPNKVSIDLQNMGNGSMIVNNITLIKEDGSSYANFGELLKKEGASGIDNLEIIINTAPTHALSPGLTKNLLKITPKSLDPDILEKAKNEIKRVQNLIAEYKIEIIYKDIFENGSTYNKDLSFLKA